MLRGICFAVVAVALCLGGTANVLAAPAAKTYEVTGPVIELTDTMIVVKKNDDRWELARTPDLKLPADLKVGDKVHITYRMVATAVETKAEVKAEKEAAKAEKEAAQATAKAQKATAKAAAAEKAAAETK